MTSPCFLTVLALVAVAGSFAAAQSPLPISPPPKVSWSLELPFRFGDTIVVVARSSDPHTSLAIARLRSLLAARTGRAVTLTDPAAHVPGAPALFLGTYDDTTDPIRGEVLRSRSFVEPPPAGEGYVLDAGPERLLVAGGSSDGLFNAIAALANLLSRDSLPGMHVEDWPDYPIRWAMSLHNLRGNGAISQLRNIADTMAALRLNGLQQTDFKYSILAEQPARYFDSTLALDTLTAARNIDLIPGVAPIGWSEGLLWHDPNLAEGFPAGAQFVVEGNQARLLSDPRVSLPNGGFEEVNGNGAFTGWSFYDPSGVQDLQEKHGGNASARCSDFLAGNAAGNSRFSRSMPCQPNRHYLLSAWVKTSAFEGDDVRLLAIGSNTKGASRVLTYTALAVPATTNGWQRVEVAFNTLEFDNVTLYCGVWGGRSGTIWWDDFEVRDGGLTNVLRRAGTPLAIRRLRDGLMAEEGRDVAPIIDSLMLAARGSYGPWHSSPEVRLLPGSRLVAGDTLEVTWFHPVSTITDAQGNGSTMVCLSEPELYDLLADQIARIDSLYAPREREQIFFGHDEIRAMNRDSACLHRGLSPASILADNMSRCVAIAEARMPGVRSFVWSDMFDSLHNAHENYYLVKGDLTGSWDSIPRSVTIVNWNGGKRDESLRFFERQGFRQITSPYYDSRNSAGIRAWRLAMEGVDRVDGMMYTTWSGDYDFLRPFAYYAWGAGPRIVHAPLDTTALSAIDRGEEVTFRATILSDPYDTGDSIVSARILLYTATSAIPTYEMARTAGDEFAVSAVIEPFRVVDGMAYVLEATNAQGITRRTLAHLLPRGTSAGLSTVPETRAAVRFDAARTTFVIDARGPWQFTLTDLLGRSAYVHDGVGGSEVTPEHLSSGVYLWQLGTASGRVVVIR